ncbi:MAG: diacylglycerol kinase family protein [Phormidesmis sp.]
MFSRDSQSSRDSEVTHDSHRDSQLADPSKKTSAKLAAPVEPSSVEEKLRSQSWQIAPNLFTSFKYAWAGIAYAFQTQRNFRVHTGVGILAMILCWALSVSTVEIAVICLTIGAVLVMEILNTALESLVDLTVGQTYHELAKVAKDCAAGAVLMSAIVALLIAALIFVPPLWDNLQIYLA